MEGWVLDPTQSQAEERTTPTSLVLLAEVNNISFKMKLDNDPINGYSRKARNNFENKSFNWASSNWISPLPTIQAKI